MPEPDPRWAVGGGPLELPTYKPAGVVATCGGDLGRDAGAGATSVVVFRWNAAAEITQWVLLWWANSDGDSGMVPCYQRR